MCRLGYIHSQFTFRLKKLYEEGYITSPRPLYPHNGNIYCCSVAGLNLNYKPQNPLRIYKEILPINTCNTSNLTRILLLAKDYLP